jgi:hypothetical protein
LQKCERNREEISCQHIKSINKYIYIHIHIWREREREREKVSNAQRTPVSRVASLLTAAPKVQNSQVLLGLNWIYVHCLLFVGQWGERGIREFNTTPHMVALAFQSWNALANT